MIYPTRIAVALTALGAPLALVAGMLAGDLWQVGAIWSAAVALLVLLDGAITFLRRKPEVEIEMPAAMAIGAPSPVRLLARFRALLMPRSVEMLLEGGDILEVSPPLARVKVDEGEAGAEVAVTAGRRGEAVLERLWMRWRGPLGLAWAQVVHPLDRAAAVAPNIAAVKDEALRLFSRDALHGLKVQIETGQGTEFHALREFMPGMDRRTMDWKQSARHGKLLAQEQRTERNHTVVLALDCGRTMCEPVEGLPRIDRAINAALLLAYVGLHSGDRVGVFGFDSKPRLSTGATSGTHSFPLIQHLVARLDYSTEETNYTLGLATLSGDLDRRSLVVIFTEFTDSIGAELMLENLKRLLKRHVVLFVVLKDEELETLAAREPVVGADISRAVTADALLKQREVVMTRLRRMGVQVVEASASDLGPSVINGYLDVKRRSLL